MTSGALSGQQPAQCVTHRGPASPADVDRSGRVGRDELQVDLLVQLGGVAVLVGGGQHVGDDDALRGGLDAQVHEARAGDLGGGDTVGRGQRGGQPAGQLARIDADLLGELQREVGRVVAVLEVAGALDRDGIGQRGGVQVVFGQHCGGSSLEQLSEVGGGHEGPSYGLGSPRPESVFAPVCATLSKPNRRSWHPARAP